MDEYQDSRTATRNGETLSTVFSSEEGFHLLMSCVQDYSIFVLDPDGVVVEWNNGAERIYGYSADEVIGQHFSCFYPPDDIDHGVPELELAAATSQPRFAVEGWRVRKDGSRFFANIVLAASRDRDDKLRGFAQVTHDISTRKQMAERFRLVVESAPSAMVMINRSGIIEMVNTQAERVFGYERVELLGQPVEILVPERFRRNHPKMRQSFYTDPQSRPMGEGRDLFGLRKNGSEFPVEIGLNPIETEDGPMVLSAIVDISARKHLEERFRLVVESAPNAMVMVNSMGAIEMVNAQAERVFGYARAEILGRPIEILVPDSFRKHHPGLRDLFFSDPLSRPMGAGRDLYARRKDGSEFPVEIGLNPIDTEQGKMVLSAIVDISDRKQKEESIKKALAEKDVLLGEIHHRVKNNLQIVHSLLDLQCTQIEDPAVQEMLRDSQNRIRSMAIIHQTLYESKDFAAIDFSNVLNLIGSSLLASYGVDNGRIRLVVDAMEMPLSIDKAIPCGLIVNELVTNVLKHAFPQPRTGSIAITLRRAGECVELTVEDDGIGIAENIDLNVTGTLGLQLVHLLTEQIGGTLEIHRANPTRFLLKFEL
jgi:PAS domain S-box-containing protein